MAAFSRDFGRPGRYFDARRAGGQRCALAVALLVLLCARGAPAGTLVQMNYANFGSVQIDLFDDLSPISVNNFVSRYVATGRYADTMIHRVDTGLGVIQGGGFAASNAAAVATAADPMITLEYSRANTRGTIAMARTAALNSATSQWFINTDNNTNDLGQANGGGYAVFGWIVGPTTGQTTNPAPGLAGMSVVDAIAALPTFNFTSPFGQLPLQNFTMTDYNNHVDPLQHVVVLSSVTVVKTHPSFQNPFLATDVNNDGSLKASDVAVVNLDLLQHGFHNLTGPFSGTSYLDVNGDGRVNLSDSLLTINALLKAAAPQVSPLMEPSASPMLVIPEPGSLTLGGLAALALAGYAARVRRQRRRAGRN
jgi:peptidyl-prolyl cis-trans isomerase A (cyclophilin A)